MEMLKRLVNKETKIAVVGLGYVGLPLAIAFAKKFGVIGYDVNEQKVNAYKRGNDPTEEVGREGLMVSTIDFTSDPKRLSEANFIIIAVPTPVKGDRTPDLSPVMAATSIVGQNLSPKSIVVYESTVYPGVTEDICRPLLEKESGLKGGVDFKIGYSPERINPGDKQHRLPDIVKIVSGEDSAALEDIAAIYGTVIEKIYLAPTIRVAEAAKLVENAQRDINIAFMNELAIVFHRMGIDTNEVVKAMDTKWNALKFRPGLVGGHCIGVDPYYFIYQAENLGYHSQIISSGRRINNSMTEFVVAETIKLLVRAKVDIAHANIVLLGMTFKEDCPDTRNSRPVDIFRKFAAYDITPIACDPVADATAFENEYGIGLTPFDSIENADCLVFLVAHKEFRELDMRQLQKMCSTKSRVLIDVKSIFNRRRAETHGFLYWNL